MDGDVADPEFIYVNWMNIKVKGNRFQDCKDGQPRIEDGGRCFNIFVDFDFVDQRKLKLVAARESNDVTMMNDEVQKIAWDNFWHSSNRGWKKIVDVD